MPAELKFYPLFKKNTQQHRKTKTQHKDVLNPVSIGYIKKSLKLRASVQF